MAKRKAAEFLVHTLAQSGVKRIYGLCGDSLNGITEVIRDTKVLEWVHVRHEEVAAFAAGAEAHLTQRLTVCAGSCGPGNLHLINGLYDCHKSRVPVLAIAAQIPSQLIGTDYFQETDPKQIFAGCSFFCETVSHPDQLPTLLKMAIETAVAKRGVSVLVLPGDISLEELKTSVQPLSISPDTSYLRPSDEALNKLAEILNGAEKITILAGAGCAGARAELLKVAGKIKTPIVHALRGKEFIEYDNPFDVGMTGLLGFSSGYEAMKECEVLLMLGTDFPYAQFYPAAKIVQVDIRRENIGRRTRVDFGVVGDIKETLTLLDGLLLQKENSKHLDKTVEHYKKAREDLDELAVAGSLKDSVHPQFVAKLLSDYASDDAVFTCDVGTPSIWAARYLKMNGRRRLLGSFNHGSMANALPQAIGAQTAFPKRQVISLSGDGGIAMLMGDLLTLRQHELPLKIVVFNNGALSFVELEMKAAGLLETATSLKNPNFAKLADAAGISGFRVDQPSDLKQTLINFLAADGPALLDVVVNRQELSMPPHLEFGQVKGFSLFALKAVISGKGSELIDLAKTNFWR